MDLSEKVLRLKPAAMAAEEWAVRLELAALYRLFDWMGWTELIYNHITAKVPGPDIRLRPVKMDFRYGASFGGPTPEAYQRLLLDAMAGDSTLFTRSDEVEAAWTFCTDLLKGWEASPLPPHRYPAGSWGPEEAERLFEGLNGSFRRL